MEAGRINGWSWLDWYCVCVSELFNTVCAVWGDRTRKRWRALQTAALINSNANTLPAFFVLYFLIHFLADSTGPAITRRPSRHLRALLVWIRAVGVVGLLSAEMDPVGRSSERPRLNSPPQKPCRCVRDGMNGRCLSEMWEIERGQEQRPRKPWTRFVRSDKQANLPFGIINLHPAKTDTIRHVPKFFLSDFNWTSRSGHVSPLSNDKHICNDRYIPDLRKWYFLRRAAPERIQSARCPPPSTGFLPSQRSFLDLTYENKNTRNPLKWIIFRWLIYHPLKVSNKNNSALNVTLKWIKGKIDIVIVFTVCEYVLLRVSGCPGNRYQRRRYEILLLRQLVSVWRHRGGVDRPVALRDELHNEGVNDSDD